VNKRWRIKQGYHCHDEHGFPDGWVTCKIYFPLVGKDPKWWENWQVKFTADSYPRLNRYMLKDYVEDVVHNAVDNMTPYQTTQEYWVAWRAKHPKKGSCGRCEKCQECRG
jgi:hypothetical protein